MSKFRLFFSGLAFVLAAFSASAQTEPQVNPAQIGSYGAAADAILVSSGSGAGAATQFKTIATLAIDPSSTNEAQTISAGGTTSPTIDLTAAGGAGGGTITLVGAGGISLSRSTNTITVTQTAGATYTGTAPIAVTGAVISLNNTAVTPGTYNNLTVDAQGRSTAGSNVAYLSAEVDGSTTNEIQALTRTTTTNTASLSVGGGSITVDDEMVEQSFAPTSGSTVTATTLPLPTNLAKIIVERGGLGQRTGTGGGLTSINTTTGVITFNRALVTGDYIFITYPKQ